jgi:hypothetical protein
MREYVFEPPLTFDGNVVIRTLDDAVAFINRQADVRWPILRDGVLHRLEGAHAEDEQDAAAKAFRGWAEIEGLLPLTK